VVCTGLQPDALRHGFIDLNGAKRPGDALLAATRGANQMMRHKKMAKALADSVSAANFVTDLNRPTPAASTS
jgi:hypothetical protein